LEAVFAVVFITAGFAVPVLVVLVDIDTLHPNIPDPNAEIVITAKNVFFIFSPVN
jgi:hypothetical protein